MSNWAGKRLGKVQIESLVGRGGVAEVYVGTHTTLHRKVAVKILRNLHEDNSESLLRFEREAQVIARFRHPNIVQVYDFDTVDNDPYLVMEYIEGPSLSDYLNTLHKNNQRLEFPQVLRLLNAIAGALQYAHNNGVVHRDIKPGNILLRSPSSQIVAGEPLPEDFEPVLTDFGLVRFLDGNRETTMGRIAGTPAYMSPEQARGEATDGRTDVYSLGIVLYQMLAGYVPFDGDSTVSILLKQVNEPPPPIPGLSPLIETTLNRALAKDTKDRFQTPMEFANEFRAALNLSSEHSTIRSAVVPETIRAKKNETPPALKYRWIRLGLLAVLAIALGGFFFTNNLQASPAAAVTPTMPSATFTLPAPTDTSVPSPSPSGSVPFVGPVAILSFENGAAIADRVSLISRAMPAPPLGSTYEFWLIGEKERISLGRFSPDKDGKGELSFSDPGAFDLFALYHRVEVTIEPEEDSDPQTSGLVAYAFTLPEEGVTHLRYLLSSFPSTPGKLALIQGLYTNLQQINQLAKEMQASFRDGQKAEVLQKAEIALNLLVGAESADHKDWDTDGVIEPKESYGLLLNGKNFGYLQAVRAETDFTVNTSNATEYMVTNGEVVKACTQNLTSWVPDLRALLVTILTSTSDAEMEQSINNLVELSNQMLNGIDRDNNGTVDPVSGECGAKLAYEYAYHMADMPLLPVSISYQLTAVVEVTQIVVAPTRSRSSSGIENPVITTPQPDSQPTANPANSGNPDNSGNQGNQGNPGNQDNPGHSGERPTKEPKNNGP